MKVLVQFCNSLARFPPPTPTYTDTIIRLLELTLNCNVFALNDNNVLYLQIRGAAMGSRVSPSYANILMGFFEETFIQSFHKQSLLYHRHIDNVLM